MEEREIKITDILKILKKRMNLIISFMVISTVFSIFINYRLITPQYVAECKLFIGKETSEEGKYNAGDITLYQKLLNTYCELFKTTDLINSALKDKHYKISAQQVLGGLTVTPKADTQFITVTFKSTNAELCKKVLDSVTEEFTKEASELIPNGNVQIIEKAKVPKHPVSPNKQKNIAMGFLAGLLIGVILSFLLEYINNSFTRPEEIEEVLGIPVIGKIPLE